MIVEVRTHYPVVVMIIGALEVLFAYPLFRKLVPPNWFYGFTTARVLNSSAVWYEVNRYYGRDMLLAGLLAVVVGGVLEWLHVPTQPLPVLAAIGVLVVPLVVIFVRATAYLRRTWNARVQREGPSAGHSEESM